MRGWLAAVLQWALGSSREAEQQLLVVDFVNELRVGDLQDYVETRLNDMLRDRDYPRLRLWLEAQQSTVNFTPWAIFRD